MWITSHGVWMVYTQSKEHASQRESEVPRCGGEMAQQLGAPATRSISLAHSLHAACRNPRDTIRRARPQHALVRTLRSSSGAASPHSQGHLQRVSSAECRHLKISRPMPAPSPSCTISTARTALLHHEVRPAPSTLPRGVAGRTVGRTPPSTSLRGPHALLPPFVPCKKFVLGAHQVRSPTRKHVNCADYGVFSGNPTLRTH